MNEQLKALEAKRKKLRKESLILTIISVVGVILSLGVYLYTAFVIPLILFFIFIIITAGVMGVKKRNFRINFKQNVIIGLINQELGPDAKYYSNSGIDLNEIYHLGVYQYPDRWHLEDHIISSYNGINYEMCDAHFEERHVTRDSKGNRRVTYVTYFKGRIIKIDFKRNINFAMKIIEGHPLGLNVRGFKQLETEVIDFNKKYNTYVTDSETGYYFLTPVMIMKLLEIEKLFKGTIQFVLNSDCFYVFINNSGDSLEFSMKRPIDENFINILKSQINLASAIINELKLDTEKFNENI